MNKHYKNIILLLLIVILLPVFLLSFYQISSLDNTEKNIEEVYNNELKAILLSINDYANDYVADLAREIRLIASEQSFSNQKKFLKSCRQFLGLNNSISSLIIADTNTSRQQRAIIIYNDSTSITSAGSLEGLLYNNKDKINNVLKRGEKSLKSIEYIPGDSINSKTLVIFLIKFNDGEDKICGMLIDPGKFINNILSYKITQVAHEDFTINISKADYKEKNFQPDNNDISTAEHQSAIDLFPRYMLSIELKGQDIKSLVKSRTLKNLTLVLAINIFIILGILFVLRNFKKENELMKLQTDFVSVVSHELRTPLSLISLFSETLMIGKINDEEKKAEYYKIINEESSRLSRIVDKILNFYTVESKGKKYNFKLENLNIIVENVLLNYKNQFDNSKFTVTFNHPDFLPEVLVDKDTVAEAVINLIDNAMKYSGDRKEIDISTGIEKNYVFIKIKDYGIGISSSNQKKIFNKFFRIKNTSDKDIKGTGLGLAIVKDVMNAHKGKVFLESSEGKGSCFTLKFFSRNLD